MAIESERIIADVIEATEFPDLAQRYQLFGVPKTVIDDTVSFEGALPEARVLAKVLEAVASQQEAGPLTGK